MASPSGSHVHSLGRLNYGEVFFGPESSSIQSSDERIELSQFSMVTLECETIERVILGGANKRVVRGGQLG